MVRAVLCGTHPSQYNGYSKVVFELSKYLGQCADVDLSVFAFQNFYDRDDHHVERQLPPTVKVYDVCKHENPKNKGFGESLIVPFLKDVDPDIVIIYNDLVIITTLLERIKKEIPTHRFKIIPYIDIVYPNERNSMILRINDMVDGGIMFTDYWRRIITAQGFTQPLHVLEHGFDSTQHYPVPKSLARTFFGIPEDDFVIVNLNRNQPRKRWDICVMVFVKFLSMNPDANIKLLIATSLNGSWDLVDIFVSEGRKYGLTFDDIKRHLIIMQNPQQLTDFDVNVMYSVADVGINTCDGEGFGMCNFEQACVGVPQVVPFLGGFRDFFTPENSITVDPKWSIYCDHARELVSGEAQICAVDDYVSALQFLMDHPDARVALGAKAREELTKRYKWEVQGRKLYEIITKVFNDMRAPSAVFEAIEAIPEKDQTEDAAAVDLDNMSSSELRDFVRSMMKKQTKP